MTNTNECNIIALFLKKLLIVAAPVYLMGCAHSNLINNADTFQDQQRYELAAQNYRRALTLRPNDQNTLENLNNSEAHYQQWLTNLEQAANKAEQDGLNGKAILLYGKLAAASNNPRFIERYDQLLESLTNYAQFYLKVDYDTGVFGADLEKGITDMTPLTNPVDLIIANEKNVHFSFQQGSFSFREKEFFQSDHYLSGYELIDNPEFISLQNNIPRLRSRIREARYDVHRYRDNIRELEHQLSRLEHSEDDNLNAINEINAKLRRAKNKRRQYQRELERQRYNLDHHLDRLSYTPLTIEQEIYSEHTYPVIESTFSLNGFLIINNSGDVNEEALNVNSVDNFHEAQGIINLQANPLQHESNQQLESDLKAQARQQARQHLQALVNNYRQSLLSKATNSINRQQRLEQWVLYGLSGQRGVSSGQAKQMVQLLQSEVGVGGEFAINALLHPF